MFLNKAEYNFDKFTRIKNTLMALECLKIIQKIIEIKELLSVSVVVLVPLCHIAPDQ